MLLDPGNQKAHSVGSAAIIKHLKAVGFACLLIATSIPQTVSTRSHLQFNFYANQQSSWYE